MTENTSPILLVPEASVPTAPAPVGPPKDSVTSAEASTMIGWARDALAKGKITQAQADQQFDELGATPEQRAGDSRTEAAKEVEALYGPVGAAEKYRFEFYPPGDPTPISPADKAVESLVRRGLVEMGFPQSNGQSLVNTVTRVLKERKGWTPEQRAAATDTADRQIETLYGNTFDDRLAPASRMLEEVYRTVPELQPFLKANNIISHPDVIHALVTQARVYDARRGR